MDTNANSEEETDKPGKVRQTRWASKWSGLKETVKLLQQLKFENSMELRERFFLK